MVIEMESFRFILESHIVAESQVDDAAVFDSVLSQQLRIVIKHLVIERAFVHEIVIKDSIHERSECFLWTANNLKQRV